MDYTVMSFTKSSTHHYIFCSRPTLTDVERFWNGSFHEFCHQKVLITLKEVNTSDVEKRKNLHEQNFNVETKQPANCRKFNPPVKQPDSFPFFCNKKQFDISYNISLACISSKTHNLQHVFRPRWVLPYIGYVGICSAKGYSFGNRVSISTILV